MKAYCCKERDGDGYAVIVYGKTRGQAKREGASELLCLCQLSLNRVGFLGLTERS